MLLHMQFREKGARYLSAICKSVVNSTLAVRLGNVPDAAAFTRSSQRAYQSGTDFSIQCHSGTFVHRTRN